jgi:hypothetical protein
MATVVDESNPLLQDFEFPPFDVVEHKHVRPGIRALLKNLVCCFFFSRFDFWVLFCVIYYVEIFISFSSWVDQSLVLFDL